MATESLNQETPEKLTVDEWLQRTHELGYFITQPRIQYEARGWKAVLEFASVMVCMGLFLGIAFGGAFIGTKYYECGEHHGK